jgi:hypothetical protein
MPRLAGLLSPSAWLYIAALLGAFGVALAAGYVYEYEPARDRVVLSVDRTAPATDSRILSATVVEVSGDTLVLECDGERLELSIPPGTPIEDLQRAGSVLPAGTAINVGAEQTDFGLVLTGLVAVEDGTVEAAP